MTTAASPLAVRLWSPGLDASSLAAGLGDAGVKVIEPVHAPEDFLAEPLLLAYTDPLGCCQQTDVEQALASCMDLLAALPHMQAVSSACRLVNLACVCVPDVVAWCVEPHAPPERPFPHCFPEPDPLHALLALELLRQHPRLAATYLSLEQHPLASLLDQRPVDANFEQRYQHACRWQALLEARDRQTQFERDIRLLAEQLEPLHATQLSCLDLQNKIQLLSARLDETALVRQRCADLEISLQAEQRDLETMTRRLSLLETLLMTATAASQSLQIRLAQCLSP
jgi:hypothetical protein